jgi:nucleoside 2-deoxyribosyltransferase
MRKRYQVFLSSTRLDLEDERRLVTEALLRAQYIPLGMEQFTAANESSWTLIQKFIDECDYYVVVVAGMYGSTLNNGVSYTENEYDYAVTKDKPVLAFLHRNILDLPNRLIEPDFQKKQLLNQFREKIEKSRNRDEWMDKYELSSKVVSALDVAKKTHPATGWIRGDTVPDTFDRELVDILKPCRAKGISKVSVDGIADPPTMTSNLGTSKLIRIMSTSATRLLEIYRPSIVRAFQQGARIQVLVPEPKSQFVKDVNESESVHVPRTGIEEEIRDIESRLIDFREEARRTIEPQQALGTAEIGYFTTHLRSTLVLCDDRWGWLTITLPPLRAPETVSFELAGTGDNSLLDSCIKHFNRTWEIMVQRSSIKRL